MLSADRRATVIGGGPATLHLDLLPDHQLARVIDAVARPRGTRSLAGQVHSRLRVHGAKVALLHERLSAEELLDDRQRRTPSAPRQRATAP